MKELLEVLPHCKNEEDLEQLADLYKSVNKVKSGGPSQEAIEWYEKNKGKLVSIKHTDMEGIVTKLNTSTRGFYPGDRFPIYIKINKDSRTNEYNAIGSTFEYDLEQLILIEEAKNITKYDPNKGDGYVIINPIKPKLLEPLNKFNPEKQVMFICKECEMTIFVKSYDDIVVMEKTCNSCRREIKSEKKSEFMKEIYLNKNAVVCNKCGNKEIRSKCVVGAQLKCPVCDSFDVYETNPSPIKKLRPNKG